MTLLDKDKLEKELGIGPKCRQCSHYEDCEEASIKVVEVCMALNETEPATLHPSMLDGLRTYNGVIYEDDFHITGTPALVVKLEDLLRFLEKGLEE